MKLTFLLLWTIFGSILAFFILKTQQWSVNQINPDRKRISSFLIIGGAVIRWAIVFTALAFALSNSFAAMLIVFCSFMVFRVILLSRWQRSLSLSREKIT